MGSHGHSPLTPPLEHDFLWSACFFILCLVTWLIYLILSCFLFIWILHSHFRWVIFSRGFVSKSEGFSAPGMW
jgi:hypothetical protein